MHPIGSEKYTCASAATARLPFPIPHGNPREFSRLPHLRDGMVA